MNVGTVEAKLAVDATDLDKLPTQARAAMARAQQEFEKAAKGITAAMQGAGSGAATAMGQPATAAEKAAAIVSAAWKRGADAFGGFAQSIKSGASGVVAAFSGMSDSAKAAKDAVMGSAAAFGAGSTAVGLFEFALTALKNPLVAIPIAVGAIVLAVNRMTASLVEDVKGVKALANASGLSIEAADDMADAFKLAGKDTDVLTNALFRMSGEIESGGAGLTRIGVSIQDLNGVNKTEGALLLEVRDAISQLGTASQRSAALMDIFGRSGKELLGVFSRSPEAFQRLIDKGRELSPMTEKMAADTLLLVASQRQVDMAWQGLNNTLVGSSIPAQTAQNEAMATTIVRMREWLESWKPLQKTMGDWAEDQAVRVLETINHLTLGFAGLTKAQADAANPKVWKLGSPEDIPFDFPAAAAKIDPFAGLSPAQIQTKILAIQKVQSEALSSIDIVAARSVAAGAQMQQTDAQVTASQLGAITQRRDAQIAAINEMLVVATRGADLTGKLNPDAANKVLEAETKKQDIIAKSELEIIAIRSASAVKQIAAFKSAQDAMGGIASAAAALAVSADIFPKNAETEMIQPFLRAIDQARAQLVALKDVLPTAEFTARLTVFDAGTESLKQWATELAKGKTALEESKEFYKNLTDQWEAGRLRIEALEFSYEKWLATLNANGALDEAKEFYAQLPGQIDAAATRYESIQTPLDNAARAGLAFQDSLAGIQREAALVGRDFDLASANLGAFKSRILELQAIKNPTGEILAEIDQLKVKFADTRSFIEWRDTFRDVFGSISSAINTSVQGVIMGTQTMAQAWDNLWKSIVLSFINSGIQRLLKGLTDWVWDFLSGVSTGGSGGGIWGALLTGGAALLAKFTGSGSSGIGPGTGTDPTGGFNEITTSVNGATTAVNQFASGVSTASAGFSAALSAVGVGLSIYSLVQGGSAKSMAVSAAGTALSVYSLAASASQIAVNYGLISTALPTVGALIASGLVAIAPAFAAALATTPIVATLAPGATALITAALIQAGVVLGPPVAAGGAVAGGAVAGGVAAGGMGAGAIAALSIMVGAMATLFPQLLYGGLMGMAAAQEMEVQDTSIQALEINKALSAISKVTTLLDDWGTALSATHLPATLQAVSDALQDMPDLFKAIGLNAFEINAMIPELRAKVGLALISALDAAAKQGIDASFVTAARAHMPDNPPDGEMSIGNADGQGYTALDLLRSLEQMRKGGSPLFDDGFGSRAVVAFNAMEQILQHLIDQNGPDASPNATRISPRELNAMVDKEFLTIALRNAVVDAGTMLGLTADQFAAAGLGRDDMSSFGDPSTQNWRMTPGDATTGVPWTGALPSVAAIAEVQAKLDAAGFTPGNYGKALEAFLISIDANIINNPAWTKFKAALDGGTITPGDITVIAAQVAADTAKGVVDKLQAELDAAIKAQDFGLIAHLSQQMIQANNALITATQAAAAAALANAPVSTTAFYSSAKKIVDNLKEQIDHQLELRAGTTDTTALGNIDKVLETMTAQVKAWAGVVQLYSALPAEMAALTGTIQQQTAAAIEAWHLAATTLADNIVDAKKQFDKALDTHNIVAIQATAQALHDAVIAQHQALVQMVDGILANLAKLREAQGKIAENVIWAAVVDLAQGSAVEFNKLYLTLANIAQTAPLAADRLFAVAQGLALVLAALPDTTKFLANGSSIYRPGDAQTVPDAIVDQLKANVAPFFGALADMIKAAAEAGDLAGQLSLLQQQADLIKQVGAAAVAAVREWARAAIEETNKAAAAMLVDIDKNWDAWDKGINETAAREILAIKTKSEAEIAANDALIKVNLLQVKANEARIAGLQAEATAIQSALQLAQQWVSALESAKGFETGLLLGEGSPLSRVQQLDLVKAQYDAARASATASPEAFGRFQSSAQQRLQVEGNAPALVAQVLKDLRAAMGGAPANNVSMLQQQLKGITDEVAGIQEANVALQEANTKLGELNTTIRDAAQADTTRWEEWRKNELDKSALLRKADEELVGKWKDAQIAAINATAETTIKNIQSGVATALRANALEQNTIIDKLRGAQLDQLNAITGGLSVQTYMADRAKESVRLLALIQGDLSALLTTAGGSPTGGAPLPPPAPVPGDFAPGPDPSGTRGIPSFASGTPSVTRTGLAWVHQGERITPASQNRDGRPNVTIHIAPGAFVAPPGANPEEFTDRVIAHLNKRARAGAVGVIDGRLVTEKR